MSRTQDALKWLDKNPGTSVYAAAKQFGLTATTLYKARKQLAETQDRRCPCCGQLVPEGQAVPVKPIAAQPLKAPAKRPATPKASAPSVKRTVAKKTRRSVSR
jgi:transposase-like protein